MVARVGYISKASYPKLEEVHDAIVYALYTDDYTDYADYRITNSAI